jgi:hypothetical protein
MFQESSLRRFTGYAAKLTRRKPQPGSLLNAAIEHPAGTLVAVIQDLGTEYSHLRIVSGRWMK